MHEGANKILDANGVFKIYDDGRVVGTSAHFSGGSTFQGTYHSNWWYNWWS